MTSEIQLLQPLRSELAAKMAAFEALRGPVVTQPIIQRKPQRGYNNRSMIDSRASARGNTAKKPPAPLPLAKRGTRQARQQAVLRENWP